MTTFLLPTPLGSREPLTRKVISAAIEVHRELGPGLLEVVYRTCLMDELLAAGLPARSEVHIPVTYKGKPLDCGFRADIVVEHSLLLELKAVERLLPIHEAQVLTYLKLTGIRVGLLFNFNSIPLKNGIRRLTWKWADIP